MLIHLVLAAALSLPSADDVIARYIAARGGIEKMHAIHSIIYRGEYREGDDVSDQAAMSLMRPYYKLVGDAEHLNPEFAEGYDGSAWEFYADPGIVVRTVGAASAAGRHAVYIDGPLAGYRERGWSVSLAGREKIGDRDAWHLIVTMPDGFEQDEFIDSETSLLIAERKKAPIHAFGAKVASETRFGDYRDIEGVLFSTDVKEIEIATGRLLNEVRWKSIVVNRDLDPAVFSPPEWKRTSVQTLMAQMYNERTDVAAVMWTYRDFHTAHPDVDLDEAMQVIGYQILKMGETATSLAILQQNATEHPTSANTAFGLGRAWAASGDQSKAIAEYRRALQLDPKHKRAADALKSLEHG